MEVGKMKLVEPVIYVENYDDPCIMIPILSSLEDYFTRVNNKVGLLVCYSIYS